MLNAALSEHAILPAILQRWSPYGFDSKPVEETRLTRIFEAARWSASSFNEQPWRFIAARREEPEAFEKLAALLLPGNAWAKSAPVLVMSVAHRKFTHNGSPNRVAVHDVGLATAQLILQAVEDGLVVHPMAGFDVEKAREVYGIPGDFEPVAMLAIGYPGRHEDLPAELRAREEKPRTRKPLREIVFRRGWGE